MHSKGCVPCYNNNYYFTTKKETVYRFSVDKNEKKT